MPSIARIGVDRAGGVIISNGITSYVYINGAPAALQGAIVAPHPGHSRSVCSQASGSVYINGLGVVRAGDVASCGHVVSASGNISAA